MSTITKVNFEPVSNTMQFQTRNFSYADSDLADPTKPNATIDGEWMSIDTDYKMVRAADISAAGNAAAAPSWPLG